MVPVVLYIFASLNFICLGEKNRQFLKETGANNSEETPSKQNKGCGGGGDISPLVLASRSYARLKALLSEIVQLQNEKSERYTFFPNRACDSSCS